MNRGDLRPIFGARSNRHFSLFDDFPPFFEMDRPVEDDHVVVTVKAIKQNHIRINELEILTLGGSALATMYISSTFAIADRIKTSKSSVTLVFAKERGWKIVHEHWSPLETWDIGYSTDRFAQPDKPPGMQRVPTTG